MGPRPEIDGLKVLLDSLVVTPQVLVSPSCFIVWSRADGNLDLLKSMDWDSTKGCFGGCKNNDTNYQDHCNPTWTECYERRRGSCRFLEGGDNCAGSSGPQISKGCKKWVGFD
jgi:hypothetical protein